MVCKHNVLERAVQRHCHLDTSGHPDHAVLVGLARILVLAPADTHFLPGLIAKLDGNGSAALVRSAVSSGAGRNFCQLREARRSNLIRRWPLHVGIWIELGVPPITMVCKHNVLERAVQRHCHLDTSGHPDHAVLVGLARILVLAPADTHFLPGLIAKLDGNGSAALVRSAVSSGAGRNCGWFHEGGGCWELR